MRTSRSWDAVARDLSAQFHVIALDARGHGDSDWTPRGYAVAERVADLEAFCERIELRDAVGVGHSTGAAVVPLCAERSPGTFSRLVLLEPLVVLDESFQRRVAPRAHQPRRTWSDREALLEYLKGHDTASRWRDDVIGDVVEHESLELADGSVDMKWASESFNWEERKDDRYDLRPVLRSLGLPTLFIASAARDHTFEELRPVIDQTPGFQKLVVDNSDHNMYMERPDAVSWAITAFAAGEELPDRV
jgi:pimeloyl-ACP methyl ester carboxylesterase